MTVEDFLSFIFPEYCIGCERSGSALCAICERTITTHAVALSKTTAALFAYHHPLIKKAIWALKYHRRRAIGKYFGTALYREFFKQLSTGGKFAHDEIILLPIPASKSALRVRGYNHAALIARAVALAGRADGLRITCSENILYKKQEITQQVKSGTKTERIKNVAHAFDIRYGEKLHGKTVIVIDDVITTGATMRDARRAIKAWRPKRILAIAVAH
jgi:ComF family protein